MGSNEKVDEINPQALTWQHSCPTADKDGEQVSLLSLKDTFVLLPFSSPQVPDPLISCYYILSPFFILLLPATSGSHLVTSLDINLAFHML